VGGVRYPAVNNVLAVHLRSGGYTLNKEKYEKPEITTEVLEAEVLFPVVGSPILFGPAD
jgi:hypothetical protein